MSTVLGTGPGPHTLGNSSANGLHPQLLFTFIYFMCRSVSLRRSDEDAEPNALELELRVVVSHPIWVLELNLGPLQVQHVL